MWARYSMPLAPYPPLLSATPPACYWKYSQLLRRPAVENMRKALYAQYSVGQAVYYGVTIVGYWAYGSTVCEYLPKELSGPRWVKMFVAPIREALDTKFLNLEESMHSRQNIKRLFSLRALFFSANTLVTAAFPFMGDFVNLLGSFTRVPLTFVFPSLIFLKVKGKTARMEMRVWHWTIVVLFSLLALATTISAVRGIVDNVTKYHLFADA
ncbi:unnamed protein product [Ilex paraguariensis]|uniref:Amino acid transporter transmembrane domain-containing protein n=1 Tax=Ilex paraguariensis TaxID=185542 RepID=A0ABC8RB47_9AQUA